MDSAIPRHYERGVQAVILAGGLGTRLGALAKNQPKSLIRIRDKPFLQYQIEFLRDGGVKEIVLCTGHLGEQIESYFGDGREFGVSITYSREEMPLGTAGAIKKAEGSLKEVFFVIYGDSYLFLDFRAILYFFGMHDKLALMTVFRNHNQYDSSNTSVAGNLVKKYSKTDKSSHMIFIDYGASVFRKKALRAVPENQYYSLASVFSEFAEKEELLAYEVSKRFYEIGSVSGLRAFEVYMETVK